MNLDPNKYVWALPTVKRLVDKGLQNDSHRGLISEVSITTGVPCLAIALFIQFIYGGSLDISEAITKISAFYKYEKVIELNYEDPSISSILEVSESPSETLTSTSGAIETPEHPDSKASGNPGELGEYGTPV